MNCIETRDTEINILSDVVSFVTHLKVNRESILDLGNLLLCSRVRWNAVLGGVAGKQQEDKIKFNNNNNQSNVVPSNRGIGGQDDEQKFHASGGSLQGSGWNLLPFYGSQLTQIIDSSHRFLMPPSPPPVSLQFSPVLSAEQQWRAFILLRRKGGKRG